MEPVKRPRQPNLPEVQAALDAQKVARRLIKTLSALGVEQRTLVTGMVAKHFEPKPTVES